ncbi:Nuclear hormone receptor, partial [Aphelenchoides avenae]
AAWKDPAETLLEELLLVEEYLGILRMSGFDPSGFRGFTLSDIVRHNSGILSASPKDYVSGREHLPEYLKPFWMLINVLTGIEGVRQLPFFQRLSLNDQEALLRHVAVPSMMLLEAFYSFVQHSSTLMMPDGLLPIKAPGRPPTNLDYDNFCRVMDPFERLQPSETEFALIRGIVCAQPACNGLSSEGRTIISEAQQKYASLLLRCMCAGSDAAVGAKRFAEAMLLVESYAYFAQRRREHFMVVALAAGGHPAKIFDEL